MMTRMNTLKLAMRSFAKATGHLFTLLPELPQPNKPTVMDSNLPPLDLPTDQDDESNNLILDQLHQNIGNYLQHLGIIEITTSDTSVVPFTDDDINHLLTLVDKSTNIPVTPSILQVSYSMILIFGGK